MAGPLSWRCHCRRPWPRAARHDRSRMAAIVVLVVVHVMLSRVTSDVAAATAAFSFRLTGTLQDAFFVGN